MSKPDIKDPVYRGRLTGIYRPSGKRPFGASVLSDFGWRHMTIEDCTCIGPTNLEELKTGDYWYAEVLRNRRPWRLIWPWQKKADIFLPFGQKMYYEGDLHRVLVRNLVINRDKASFLSKEWDEASGDIYFQLEPKPVPVVKPVAEPASVTVFPLTVGVNVVTNTPAAGVVSASQPAIQPAGGNVTVVVENPSNDGDVGSWATWFGRILATLVACVIGYYLWQSFPILGWIFLALVGFRLLAGIFNAFPTSSWIATLAILGFAGYYLFRVMERNGMATEQLKTREGSVRVAEPRRSGTRKPDGSRDSTSEKEVRWFDFSENRYRAVYATSKARFQHSTNRKRELRDEARERSTDAVGFATEFYRDMCLMDRQKIGRVAKIFSDSARRMGLSPLQTAEMVVTFIQEIPYVLIHDGSCHKAVSDGIPFVVEYHAEKKPCLPNVTEGIQSPYEFLHNLKGDCDTRALLGLALLGHLNIGSSLWISETYAHSILGVAVPAGSGIYKEVGGIRHYGVELTAKGYRIGMVAPEQSRPRNWTVTAYNNPK